MAADLHIHVLNEKITESMLHTFNAPMLVGPGVDNTAWNLAYETIGDSEQIWVGEVSWLKAMVFQDTEEFIPGPIMKIAEIIPSYPPVLVNDVLLRMVKEAFETPNQTTYSTANPEEVLDFLTAHIGHLVFTVSW